MDPGPSDSASFSRHCMPSRSLLTSSRKWLQTVPADKTSFPPDIRLKALAQPLPPLAPPGLLPRDLSGCGHSHAPLLFSNHLTQALHRIPVQRVRPPALALRDAGLPGRRKLPCWFCQPSADPERGRPRQDRSIHGNPRWVAWPRAERGWDVLLCVWGGCTGLPLPEPGD